MADEDSWLIDFPTLGHLVCAWIERHCRQPDGPLRGRPVVLSDWQYWLAANRWRIREDAPYVPPEEVTVEQSDGAQSGVHLSNDVDRRTAEMGQGAMHGVLHRRRGLRAHHLRWLGTGRRRVPLRRQRLPVRLGVAVQSGRAERPSASVAAHPADRQLRGTGTQHLPSSRGDDPAGPAQGAHAREGHLHPHIATGARRRGRRLGLGSHRRGDRLGEIPSGQSDHGRRTGRGRPVHEIERHDSGRHHAAPRSRRHGRPHTCVDERMGSGRGQLRAAGVRERRGRRVRVLPEPRSREIIASPRRPAVGLQSEIRTVEDARIRVSRLPVGST